MEEDKMQLQQLDSAKEHAGLTSSTQDNQDPDEEYEHNSSPHLLKLSKASYLDAFVKRQSNKEQLLEK